MSILTRAQVEQLCCKLQYPTGAGGEQEPALRAILEHDAAQRARIRELEQERDAFSNDVRIVWIRIEELKSQLAERQQRVEVLEEALREIIALNGAREPGPIYGHHTWSLEMDEVIANAQQALKAQP